MGTSCVEREKGISDNEEAESALKPIDMPALQKKRNLDDQELFIFNEIFKQRNIKIMEKIRESYKAITTSSESILPSVQIWERKHLEATKVMLQNESAVKFSIFLSESLYKSAFGQTEAKEILHQRDTELQQIIDSALSGEWKLGFIEVPHPDLLLGFYRHYKAINVSMCQYLIQQKPGITEKKKALEIWVTISKQVKEMLKNIVDIVIENSPDLVYQMEMMGEYFRLSEHEDSFILNEINKFFEKMTRAIEAEEVTVPLYEGSAINDCAGLDDYYCSLLNIGSKFSGEFSTVSNHELFRLETPH